MNLGACTTLQRWPETGTWYRAVPLTVLATALSSAHSKTARTRFNPGALLPANRQFEILYFAEDPLTANFECGAMLGNSFVPGGAIAHPCRSFAMLNAQMTLSEVVDLTDVSASQLPLQTTAQEMTGDWDGYQVRGGMTSVSAPVGVAPTQALGQALFQTGVEGFQPVSARVSCNRTLMVFPQNLRSGSKLEFRDQSGAIVHQIP
ncbi:MAG: RES family NAD+ phosphorylase [Stellaceae bacterium]